MNASCSRVAGRDARTINRPVASGSSVPACPTFLCPRNTTDIAHNVKRRAASRLVNWEDRALRNDFRHIRWRVHQTRVNGTISRSRRHSGEIVNPGCGVKYTWTRTRNETCGGRSTEHTPQPATRPQCIRRWHIRSPRIRRRHHQRPRPRAPSDLHDALVLHGYDQTDSPSSSLFAAIRRGRTEYPAWYEADVGFGSTAYP